MSYEELKGRTFVVTGAGSGIGKATSVLLAEQGANVALLDLRAPETVAKELEAMGCQCLALACNVQNATEVDTATKAIVSHFGALHGAANLAGIAETSKTASGNFPLESLDDADWDAIMKTNLDGVKNCVRSQLKEIKGAGSIVNAASTAGQYGPPNCSPYVCSKWAVIGLTKTASREGGKRNLRVNAVAPGVVQTGLTKPTAGRDKFLETTALGRIAQPIEIGRAILFLLSDQSSFVTGSVVNVDGGYF